MNDKLSEFGRKFREAGKGYMYYTDPEYLAIRAEYNDKVELKYEYVDRRTTLQLNRIFKLAA